MVKEFLSALWCLAHRGGEHKNATIAVGLARLVSRCMRKSDEQVFDRDLLEMGADERKWQAAVVQARKEYNDGSASSWFVSADALPHAAVSNAKRPHVVPVDASMRGIQCDEGWIASGAWKRSPEVARNAPSLKGHWELSLIGCQCDKMSPEDWEKETPDKAAKLPTRLHEERGGSRG